MGWPKGIPQSEEAKEKNRLAQLGRHPSEETREKIRLGMLGKRNRAGHTTSPEHRDAISKANRGRKPNAEAIRHMSESHKGRKSSQETRAKMSAAQKARHRVLSEDNILKMAEGRRRAGFKRGPLPESTKEKVRQWNLGRRRPPAQCEKARQHAKQLWKDNEYVRKQMRARGVKPNKPEMILAGVLQDFGFRFTGDGQLIVAGRCPDFWDGDKRLIELYGDYWHRNQDPADREALFKRHGYDTLVIWERELKAMSMVRQRVKEFCGVA